MPDPLNVPLTLGVSELVAVTEEVPEPVAVSEGVGDPLREGVPDPVTVTEEVPEPLTV